MPTVSGDDAIAWMRAKMTNVPGSCLNTIWQAYGSHPSTGPHAGQYPDAIDGWLYAARKHPGDPTPPPGYPVYFDALSRPRYAGDTNYASGDIVLSLGGGQVICTDGAGAGRISTMSITQRARQIGRTYLGWTEDFLGYDVVTSATAAGLGTTPLEDDLNADQDNKLNQIYNALFAGGASLPDRGRSIGASLAGIVQVLDKLNAILSQPVQRTVNGKVVAISQIQELADTKTLALDLSAQVGALRQSVAAIATSQGLDPAAIEDAARAGAEQALRDLTLRAVSDTTA